MGPAPRAARLVRAAKNALLFLLGLAFCAFLGGCTVQKAPDLLSIDAVTPATLEPDGELRIEGSGFPEGRSGTLTLSGVVHAPAQPPREISWEAKVRADSSSTILLHPSRRALLDLTQGVEHATFRGSARLHFNPVVAGRPPLGGTNAHVILDVFTPGAALREDPRRFQAFLGLTLGDNLVVTEVTKDSIASSVGLNVGDQLHELDGVRLDSMRDFLPQARARTSVLVYSRMGHAERIEAHLPRAEFQVMESALLTRALAIIAGTCLALLLAARPPRLFVWLSSAVTSGRKGRVVWLPGLGERGQTLAYPIFFVVVTGLFWLQSGVIEQLLGLELLGLLAGGALLSLMAAFLLGGEKSSRSGFSLLGAFHSTLLRLVVLMPVIVAGLVRASGAGTLRLAEVAHAQGALPPRWGLFESPFSFLLGVAYLFALLPISGRRAPLEGHPGQRNGSVLSARMFEWAGHLVLLGVWVILYAGAPVSWGESSLFAGGLFTLKLALLTQLVAWVRARTGHLRLSESWGFFAGAALLTSLTGAAAELGLLVSGLLDRHAEIFGLFSATLCATWILFAIVSSQRSWAHLGRKSDPWI